jgi:hypothetical protein
MTYFPSSDFWLKVQLGQVSGYSIISKFGRNNDVGTSLEPITGSGVYQTPTSATSLEILSSSSSDTDTSGSGAHAVTIEGLDANFALQSETVNMNGTNAVSLSNTYTRVFRMYVAESGTYATASAGSHVGTITLRVASAGATWATIDLVNSFPVGQTQIGAYTIPDGSTGYVLSLDVTVNATQDGDIIFFQRPNADDVSSPYTGAIRVVEEFIGVAGSISRQFTAPVGPFVGPCDIGFMGLTAAGSGEIEVDFQILLTPT